jgi:hypothetical protein
VSAPEPRPYIVTIRAFGLHSTRRVTAPTEELAILVACEQVGLTIQCHAQGEVLPQPPEERAL